VVGAKPETITDPEPDCDSVPVIPLGELVAVYVVIVAPPSLAGAVNGTVAVVPETVAVPIVGAPGTIAATEAVEFEFAATPLGAIELVAVTTQRIVLPTSAATNTYVLEVAPLMFVVTRCH
jgi:hypothetical protein